jgi:hypothetical protein
MLDLLGRKADGWIAPLATGYETKPAAQDRIDAAARGAGRDPAGIRRTTPDIWAEIITELAAGQRFDTINLIPEQDTAEQLRLFGTEVIPLARAGS